MSVTVSFSRYWREIRYGPNRIPKLPPAEGHAVLATLEKSEVHEELVEFTDLIRKYFMSLSTFNVRNKVLLGMFAAKVVHTGVVIDSFCCISNTYGTPLFVGAVHVSVTTFVAGPAA